MKRYLRSIGIIVLVLALSGCSSTGNKTSDMSIEKAKLTKEEENILDLVSVNNPNMIYDYNADVEVQAIKINVYKLKDGKWISQGREIINTEESSGRVALSFDKIGEGYRIAHQTNTSNGSSFHESEITIDSSGVGTMFLDSKEKIEYEKEIPLVIQTLSSKDFWNTFTPESYFTPEEIEADQFDYVYSITIMFSKKTANKLGK